MDYLKNFTIDNQFKTDELSTFKEKLFFEGAKRRVNLEQFAVLLFLSTAIATYGVVGDSVATVIGAMIIAPFIDAPDYGHHCRVSDGRSEASWSLPGHGDYQRDGRGRGGLAVSRDNYYHGPGDLHSEQFSNCQPDFTPDDRFICRNMVRCRGRICHES